MDSTAVVEFVSALNENTAALAAVNDSLWYGFGFLLGFLFVWAVYRLWFF